MSLAEVMQTYFRGEKQTAYWLIALGVVLLGVALWSWRTQSGAFSWSLLTPLALLGAGAAKVNANWPRLKLTWAVITVGALVLVVLVKRDWASGLGLALLLLMTAGFFTDVLAERRANLYTDALAAQRVH